MKLNVMTSIECQPMNWAIVDDRGTVVALFSQERFAKSFFQSNHAMGLKEVVEVHTRGFSG